MTAIFNATIHYKEPVVGETDPRIFVESKKAVKGSTFTVTVEVKNNPGFAYLELTRAHELRCDCHRQSYLNLLHRKREAEGAVSYWKLRILRLPFDYAKGRP